MGVGIPPGEGRGDVGGVLVGTCIGGEDKDGQGDGDRHGDTWHRHGTLVTVVA